jgi:hypothetical protein
MTEETDTNNAFSAVMVHLLRGVLYADDHPALWQSLLSVQARARDYVREIGLDLVVHEDEGFAWLQTRLADGAENESVPRLVQKRQLSYPVSLLLALLRRRLAEHDATSSETRLIIDTGEIAEMIRIFLAEGSNEAKVLDQIDTHINKVIELGFSRRLRTDRNKIEIRRILKAFVDAQWLGDFDAKLRSYMSKE